MIQNIEALQALATFNTMEAAGVAIRVSQSAISKRIAQLEHQIGKKLIEKSGRKVQLTPAGTRFLAQINPLMAEIKAVINDTQQDAQPALTIGIAESILTSWGANLINQAKADLSIELFIHTHRSPLVIEKVRSGEFELGLCVCRPISISGMIMEKFIDEPMVIIPANLKRSQAFNMKSIMTIEKNSETWRSINEKCLSLNLNITRHLESFFAIAQLARFGLGNALVPISVAHTLGIDHKSLNKLGLKLKRPIYFIARKTTFNKPSVKKLIQIFRDAKADLQSYFL